MGLLVAPFGLKAWSSLWVYKFIFSSELKAIPEGGQSGETRLPRERCSPGRHTNSSRKVKAQGRILTAWYLAPDVIFTVMLHH